MISKREQQYFECIPRPSQPLRNDTCQNILYKAVFEHFEEFSQVAALLLSSKSFQNSSFGANFLLNFKIDGDSVRLFSGVLSPGSCFSLQFVPSLSFDISHPDNESADHNTANFAAALAQTKYLPLQLRSLTLDRGTNELLLSCFADSISFSRLQSLELKHFPNLENETLALAVTSSPNLVSLAIANCQGDIDIECVSTLTKSITSLELTTITIADAALDHVSRLSKITSLNLDCCEEISDAGLLHVAKLSLITNLNLSSLHQITDDGLGYISQLSNMVSLNLSWCSSISDAGLELVTKMSGITSLTLTYCILITDAGVESVSKLLNMTNLDFSLCRKITAAGWQHLTKLVHLESLHLGGTTITDAGLVHVSKMSNLRVLNLDGCGEITDVGLQLVSNLPKLKDIDVRFCSISTEAKKKFRVDFPHCVIVD